MHPNWSGGKDTLKLNLKQPLHQLKSADIWVKNGPIWKILVPKNWSGHGDSKTALNFFDEILTPLSSSGVQGAEPPH